MDTIDALSRPRPTPRTQGRRPPVKTAISAVAAIGVLASVACRSTDPIEPSVDLGRAIAAQAGADITLAPGGVARVADANLNVGFQRLVGDSRCPTKALIQCAWAGSVVVDVQAGPIIGFQYLETRRLETVAGRDTATVAGQLIRLVRALPEKETIDEIPAANYRIVLRVGNAK
ncbi:MAG: hypothetical protein V4617_01520 [Gemmatimonadota bacterium]